MNAGAPSVAAALGRRLGLELRGRRARVLLALLATVVVFDYLTSAEQGSLGIRGGVDEAARVLILILPLALALLPALAVATERELGLDRERRLDGVPDWSGTLTIAAAGMLVALAALAAALAAGGLLGALDAVLRSPAPGARTYSSISELMRQLAVGAPFWTLMGAALGAALGARFAAVGALTGLTTLVLVLERVANLLPGLLPAYALTPPGAITLALGGGPDGSGLAGSYVFLDLVIVAWAALSMAALRRGFVRARRHGGGRLVRRREGRVAHRGPMALACCAGLAFVGGWIVPPGLRAALPWYLRPEWLAEQAAGTASDDVARRYLALVARGDRRHAAELTARKDPLGPFRPLFVPRPRYVEVTISESLEGAPGTVSVHVGRRPESSRQYTICLVRRSGSWRVREIQSRPDC